MVLITVGAMPVFFLKVTKMKIMVDEMIIFITEHQLLSSTRYTKLYSYVQH